MRSRAFWAKLGCMKSLGRKKSRPSRRRAAAEQVAQAFSIASQMALLCPSGLDESMRRELGHGGDYPRRTAVRVP